MPAPTAGRESLLGSRLYLKSLPLRLWKRLVVGRLLDKTGNPFATLTFRKTELQLTLVSQTLGYADLKTTSVYAHGESCRLRPNSSGC